MNKTAHRPATASLFITVLLLLAVEAAPPPLPIKTLKTDFTAYVTRLNGLCASNSDIATNLLPVLTYLTTCRDGAQRVLARLGHDGALELLTGFRDQRIAAQRFARKQLGGTLHVSQAMDDEEAIYKERIGPKLEQKYGRDIEIQSELFHRKYLAPDDGQANIFEALAQDCPLKRFNDQHPAWYRTAGVSAWEVKLRLEPVVVLGSSTDPAVLLSGGLVFNFFPTKFTASGAVEKETLFSEYVKRTGLCLGGGARFHDGGQTLLVSGGRQIRCVTLWGLYDTAAHEYFFGLGVSEWDWLKNFLPGGLLNVLPK